MGPIEEYVNFSQIIGLFISDEGVSYQNTHFSLKKTGDKHIIECSGYPEEINFVLDKLHKILGEEYSRRELSSGHQEYEHGLSLANLSQIQNFMGTLKQKLDTDVEVRSESFYCRNISKALSSINTMLAKSVTSEESSAYASSSFGLPLDDPDESATPERYDYTHNNLIYLFYSGILYSIEIKLEVNNDGLVQINFGDQVDDPNSKSLREYLKTLDIKTELTEDSKLTLNPVDLEKIQRALSKCDVDYKELAKEACQNAEDILALCRNSLKDINPRAFFLVEEYDGDFQLKRYAKDRVELFNLKQELLKKKLIDAFPKEDEQRNYFCFEPPNITIKNAGIEAIKNYVSPDPSHGALPRATPATPSHSPAAAAAPRVGVHINLIDKYEAIKGTLNTHGGVEEIATTDSKKVFRNNLVANSSFPTGGTCEITITKDTITTTSNDPRAYKKIALAVEVAKPDDIPDDEVFSVEIFHTKNDYAALAEMAKEFLDKDIPITVEPITVNGVEFDEAKFKDALEALSTDDNKYVEKYEAGLDQINPPVVGVTPGAPL